MANWICCWGLKFDLSYSKVIFLYPRSVPLCCITKLSTDLSTLTSCPSSLMPLLPHATHPRSPKVSVSDFLSNPSIFLHLFLPRLLYEYFRWWWWEKEVARNYWVLPVPLNSYPYFWSWVGKKIICMKNFSPSYLASGRNSFYLDKSVIWKKNDFKNRSKFCLIKPFMMFFSYLFSFNTHVSPNPCSSLIHTFWICSCLKALKITS